MSQFTPVFHGSGTGATEGAVPNPGSTAGSSRYLREDAVWAVPNAGPPGPPAPAPGPALDQWACNAAGYILYDICYKLVKSAVDTNLISLGLDAVVAFAFDGLSSILLPLEILDAGFLTFLENWVSTQVQANLSTFLAHLLDQTLWSKFHCFLYNDFRAAGGVSQAILLAAGTSLAASGIAPTAVTNGIALLLQQFGVMTVGPVPLSAFVQNYDCSGCAGTGTDTAPIPLQSKFDLVISDGSTRATFVQEIDVAPGKVSESGQVATFEPHTNVQKADTLIGSRPTLNIIDGSGISTTVADDPTDNRVNITIAGGGFANPMTSADDMIVGGTAGAPSRLPVGSVGQFLGADPVSGHVGYESLVAGSGITLVRSAGQTEIATAGTGAGGTACTQIGKVTLPLAVNGISFTTIPATFSQLMLSWQVRGDFAGSSVSVLYMRFNNDNSAVYSFSYSFTSATTQGYNSGEAATQMTVFGVPTEGAGFRAHTAGTGTIWLPGYANTNFYSQFNGVASLQDQASADRTFAATIMGTYAILAAINRIDLFMPSGNMEAGSTATLWGFI